MEHKYKIHLYVHIIAKTSRSIALLKKFNSQKGYLLLPMFIKRYINQTQPLTLEQDQPWFSLIPKVQKLTGTKMRYALLNRKQAYR